jgi:hypothetical protein
MLVQEALTGRGPGIESDDETRDDDPGFYSFRSNVAKPDRQPYHRIFRC